MAVCRWVSMEELVSIVKTTVRVRTADEPTAIQARHTEHTVEPRSNRMRSMACRFETW
jgi:hypothetical protein